MSSRWHAPDGAGPLTRTQRSAPSPLPCRQRARSQMTRGITRRAWVCVFACTRSVRLRKQNRRSAHKRVKGAAGGDTDVKKK